MDPHLKLKLPQLHPLRARALYRSVGLALWDSWGELIPKSFMDPHYSKTIQEYQFVLLWNMPDDDIQVGQNM
jgi:hypothetical protein